MRLIAAGVQPFHGLRTAGRQHDVLSHADRVAGEFECFRFWHREPTGGRNAFRNGRVCILVKCGGIVQQVSSAQGTEACIQMVKPASTSSRGRISRSEYLAQNRKRADSDRCLYPPNQPSGKPRRSPAPSKYMSASSRRFRSHALETTLRNAPLPLSFGISKTAGHGPSAHHNAGVGSEHQVRQS